MTLQKAMRTRSELKKAAENLKTLISRFDAKIYFDSDEEPEPSAVESTRSKPQPALDGMSYGDAVKKLFAIIDECAVINKAIEAVNKRGHELLFIETALKSKLAVVDRILNDERSVIETKFVEKVDYSQRDSKGDYLRRMVERYYYPLISESTFGASAVQLQKSLSKQIADVRDELAAFNATTQVEYKLPDNLI